MAKKPLDFDEVAVVVDDSGRLRAHFQGLGAGKDAAHHLRVGKGTGVKEYQGAVVVTGADAKKAIEKGRI